MEPKTKRTALKITEMWKLDNQITAYVRIFMYTVPEELNI